MPTELTPAVVRAMERAPRLAGAAGAAAVESLHLLLALIEEEEGRASGLLGRLGVDRSAVQIAFGVGDDPSSDTEPQPVFALSESVERVLNLARREAADGAIDRALTGDQILLALIRHDAELRRKLEPFGLDATRLGVERGTEALAMPLEDQLRLGDPTEQIEAARIVDANANRAREALRVIEDYCRFVLDDAFLSRTCKELRHDLAGVLAGIPSATLLAARDTLGDVGTSIATTSEQHRDSTQAVVQANLKRLQESLRSIEEFGKVHGPSIGQACEQLRYRTYTLERALIIGVSARDRLGAAVLYVLVTGSQCKAALDWTIQEALAGGAQIVQLREKTLNDRDLLDRARLVRRLTHRAGALFIMNDRPDLARLAEADGVHVGQDELPVKEARRIVGADGLIGVSTHNVQQLRQAILDGASYVGVGPTFPSGTKAFEEFPGLGYVREAMQETSLPAFVIGGVNLENVDEVIQAGGRRVAVSQAICQAEAPSRVAGEFRRRLERKG